MDPIGQRRLVDEVLVALPNDTYSPFARAEDVAQPIRIRMLQAILFLRGDPDYRALERSADESGWAWESSSRAHLRLMPETSLEARGPERLRFRPTGRTCRYGVKLGGIIMPRPSFTTKAILERLEEADDRGLALQVPVEEAAFHHSNLTINWLAGNAKVSEEGEAPSVRLVLDGTHGVVVNRATRQRDKDRCPVAAGVRRVRREQPLSRPARGLALRRAGGSPPPARPSQRLGSSGMLF